MKHKRNFFYICILTFFYFVQLVQSQEGTICNTPLNRQGVCVEIKRCDALITLLRTQSNNPEVRSYLVRSTCGYNGNVPVVCCPQADGSQFRTTSTTAEPEIVSPPVVPDNKPLNVLPSPPNCGSTNGTLGRVVGGVPAKYGEFNWMVALGYKNRQNPNQPKWLCGGSLITERHILTAAHCVYNRQDLYLARLGDIDLFSDDDEAYPETIPLIKAKIHEEYSPTTYTNDIAILTLSHKPDGTKIWPICMPIAEPERSMVLNSNQMFVAGWGALNFNGPSSSSLQKVMLQIQNREKCKEAFANFKSIIDERVICTFTPTKDACQGDSGGPLMLGRINGALSFYQMGVVSYGYKCAEPGFPGVYTNVPHFVDWIQKNVDV